MRYAQIVDQATANAAPVKHRNGVRPEALGSIRVILDRISKELLDRVVIPPVPGAAAVRFR